MPRDAIRNFAGFGPRFRQRGLRMTTPRRVILEVLDDYDGYASAEDIFMQVHRNHPGIGLATVYRTLILLNELSLVNKIDPGDGKFRYQLREEKNDAPQQHLLICTGCFMVIKYSNFSDQERNALHSIEGRLAEEHDFSIERHEVHYYGICPRCRAEKPAAS